MTTLDRRSISLSAVLLLVAVRPGLAHAQGGEANAAEVLFREGKRLLELKDFTQACPKLAESFRLDPATGALLALAICHEGEGKTATAWVEYTQVATRAKHEGRPDREQAARAKAASLERRLSTLTITVPPALARTPGLHLLHDGKEIAEATWGLPVPVDPGPHEVQATAPGTVPFLQQVTIGDNGDRKVVEVPALAPAPVVAPLPVLPPVLPPVVPPVAPAIASGADIRTSPAAPSGESAPATGLPGPRLAGVVLAGAGALALVGGGIFTLRALSKKHEYESQPNCQDTCPALRAANTAGNTATGFVIGGVVLAGAGVALYTLGRPHGPPTTSLRVQPAISPGQGSLVFAGAF